MNAATNPGAAIPLAILFGARVKERRKAMRLSQGQLADIANTTTSYLSLIENGRANPTLDMIVKLSEAVGSEAWRMLKPEPGQ